MDPALHGGLGPPLAQALHDDRVPAGHPTHRPSPGVRIPQEVAPIAAFEPVQDLVWKLLLSLAFVYMATRVPSLLGNAGTFDSWLSTLYFGMNLPASMVRSARTIGLLAGGATAGPGGIAAGAMATSGGLSATASGLASAASMSTPSEGGDAGGQSPRSAAE